MDRCDRLRLAAVRIGKCICSINDSGCDFFLTVHKSYIIFSAFHRIRDCDRSLSFCDIRSCQGSDRCTAVFFRIRIFQNVNIKFLQIRHFVVSCPCQIYLIICVAVVLFIHLNCGDLRSFICQWRIGKGDNKGCFFLLFVISKVGICSLILFIGFVIVIILERIWRSILIGNFESFFSCFCLFQ